MYFSDFISLLHARLVESATQSQSDVVRELCDELGIDDLEFQYETGRPIHGRTLFGKTLQHATYVSVRVPLRSEGPEGSVPGASHGESSVRATAAAPAASKPNDGGGNVDFSEQFFIREFDRLERKRGMMWAGFVVQQMLPGLGFGPFESKQVLKQLEAKGIVVLEKRPNPKNPEHPTTCVRLNRENARVRSVLQNGTGLDANSRIRVQGELVSETIIRERR